MKAHIIFFSIVAIMSGIIAFQRERLSHQSTVIENSNKENSGYKYIVDNLNDTQKRVNLTLHKFNRKQKNINIFFDKAEDYLNNEYNGDNWDENKIPSDIVCIINCVQRSTKKLSCDCQEFSNNDWIPSQMRHTEA